MKVDVVVVGGGGAGIAAATAAREAGARVLLVSKEPASLGDTRICTGVMAVPGLAPGDDAAAFAADVLRSGAGLAQPALVAALAEGAAGAFGWWRAQGHRPDREADGQPRRLAHPMGGHGAARSVPAPGRGPALGHALADAVDRADVQVWDDAWVTGLRRVGRRVAGVHVLLARTGERVAVTARAVVLATGGIGTLFWPRTDTMRTNTGDGHRLALAAGAALVDMEQVQFTPFGTVQPPVGLPLGEAVIAGPRGVLRDAAGAVLLSRVLGRPRAELAGCIAAAVAGGRGTASGGVLLDVSANDRAWRAAFRRDWGHVLRRVRGGFDSPWEVGPTAHYHMGGVRAGGHGDTGVEGLFVAGQVMGGVHGANRLGSTSLPSLVVFGRRAGRAAAAVPWAGPGARPPAEVRRAGDPVRRLRALQVAARTGAGPARTGAGLAALRDAARAERARLAADPPAGAIAPWDVGVLAWLELCSLAVVAEAVAEAGLSRPASLGAHLRLDGVGEPAPSPTVVHALPPPPAPTPLPPPTASEAATVPFVLETSAGPRAVAAPARPTLLGSLLWLRENGHPDLALRHGCRNARCGTCTVSVDGRPRLACRDRLKPGQHVAPLDGVPVVRDLVVDRGAVDGRLRGRLPPRPASPAEPGPRARRLDACIACLACVPGCPLAEQGRGDPMSLLRIERARLDGAEVRAVALDLGIATCADCLGCRCGVGIRLDRDVLLPLLEAVAAE